MLLVPSPNLSAEEIWTTIPGSVSRVRVVHTLRVLAVTDQLERNAKDSRSELALATVPTKSIMPSGAGKSPEDTEIGRSVRGDAQNCFPTLAIAFLNDLEALATSVKIPLTPEVVDTFPASVRTSLGAPKPDLVAIGSPGTTFSEPLRSVSAIHVNVRCVKDGPSFVARSPGPRGSCSRSPRLVDRKVSCVSSEEPGRDTAKRTFP